jgi:5'-3' exonuclease
MESEGEINKEMLRHLILNSYRVYKKKFGKEYGELVICNDSKGSWRREFFPQYKQNRKDKRKSDSFDWNNIHSLFDELRIEFKDTFPYKNISVDAVEADDIIAILCRHYYQEEKMMIVSSDKDFQQLQLLSGISQWSPLQKKMVECENPKIFLYEHLLRGDRSDGVPNVLSDDDTFVVSDKRQKRMTKKVVASLFEEIKSGDIEKRDNWKRNNRLINLFEIPEDTESNIIEEFRKELAGNRGKILNYFIKNKLSTLMEVIEEF